MSNLFATVIYDPLTIVIKENMFPRLSMFVDVYDMYKLSTTLYPSPYECFVSLLSMETVSDIDECSSDETNACGNHTLCNNLEPGYNCTCVDGYELQADERTCLGTLILYKNKKYTSE